MPLTIINHPPGSTVFIPDILVHGQSSEQYGIIHVTYHDNCFPSQSFEVNCSFFKLLVHLAPGFNEVTFTQHSGHFENGYPKYDQAPQYPPMELKYQFNYSIVEENPVVNLCLLVAKDSPLTYDAPEYKIRSEGNGINTAISKLRFGARLMQALTAEQMARNGFGNRCFRFAEEETEDTLSAQDPPGTRRSTVKVHVLRVEQTVAEIRDPNVAQQNPHGNNTGALFDWAATAINNYGPPFSDTENPQAACMWLDAHWDPNQSLLLGHAALGGSHGNLRLAIFGSQGLWSWPKYYEELYYSFSDCTKTDTSRVVNDCNECGSAWEALNISLGAFLHEIGHSLGCPHSPSGIMLRDYVTLNRTFMTREFPSTRTGHQGYAPVLAKDECGWYRLDIIRFLYHPAFRLPIDFQDDSIPNDAWSKGQLPSAFALEDNTLLFEAPYNGIYLVELWVEGANRAHLEYLPHLSNNGPGPQKQLALNYRDLQKLLPEQYRNKKLELWVLAVGLHQTDILDFLQRAKPIESDFGLGRGSLQGFQTQLCGRDCSEKTPLIAFDPTATSEVTVYYGMALDGISFTNAYTGHTALLGNSKSNVGKFYLEPGERILGFNVRSGAWVDAVQVVTDRRVSEFYGNTGGGGLRQIKCPPGYSLIGLYGWVGSWVDAIQGIYVKQ